MKIFSLLLLVGCSTTPAKKCFECVNGYLYEKGKSLKYEGRCPGTEDMVFGADEEPDFNFEILGGNDCE